MAFRFGPTIKNNSLVYLDTKLAQSYPGLGNTVYDLTENGYNAELFGYSGATLPIYNINGYFEQSELGSQISGSTFFTNNSFGNNKASLEAVIYHNTLDNTDNIKNPGGVQRYVGIYSYNPSFTETFIVRTAAYAGVGCIQTYIVNDGNSYNFAIADNQFEINKWYHVVSVWDGLNLIIYKNGNLISSTFIGNITMRSTANDTYSMAGKDYESLNGRFGMGRIYNRALTSNEVLQKYLYNKPRFGIE